MKYYFGNDETQLCGYANHADTSTDVDWRNTACSDGVGEQTAQVGQYRPNALVFTTCTAMSGSGDRIAGTTVMWVRRVTGAPG